MIRSRALAISATLLATSIVAVWLLNSRKPAITVQFFAATNELGLNIVTFEITNVSRGAQMGTCSIQVKHSNIWMEAKSSLTVTRSYFALMPKQTAFMDVARDDDVQPWRLKVKYQENYSPQSLSRFEQWRWNLAVKLRNYPRISRLIRPRFVGEERTVTGPEMPRTHPLKREKGPAHESAGPLFWDRQRG